MEWISSDNNEIVHSNPPCIDEDNKLLTKICYNNTWLPKTTPKCQEIVKETTYCPAFMAGDCVFMTQPTNWYNHCNFSTNLKFYNHNKPIANRIWVPIARTVPYGPFEYVNSGENYGCVLKNLTTDNLEDFLVKNCVVFDVQTNEYFPEDCNKNFQHICTYNRDFQFEMCPNGCVSTGIGSTGCFCKRRTSKCENYPTIHTIFDKNVLRKLVSNDTCYISKSESVFPFLFGKRQAINSKSWMYTADKLNCSICYANSLKPNNSRLVLTFDEHNQKLYLTIFFQEFHIIQDEIYCFTDASEELKKRIDVKQLHYYKGSEKESFFVFKLELEKLLGQYWCELNKIRSNTVLAYKKRKGNEFSLKLRIKNVCNEFNCKIDYPVNYYEFLNENFTQITRSYGAEVRIMEIFLFDLKENVLELLLHLSTKNRRHVNQDYYRLDARFREELPDFYKIVYFRSSEFCLETTTDGTISLKWPLTKLGSSVVSEDICLGTNGHPLTRTCSGNFLYGAQWSEISSACFQKYELNNVTAFLRNVANDETASEKYLEQIATITTKSLAQFSALDVYYIGNILKKAFITQLDALKRLVDITSNVLKTNKTELENAQKYLNSSDTILKKIEDISREFQANNESYLLIEKGNLIFHMSDPFSTNISGIYLHTTFLNKIVVENLYRNQSVDEIIDKTTNLQLLVSIPEEILEDLTESNVKIIITVYFNDYLFSDDTSTKMAISKIVSVSISGYGHYVTKPLKIFFKGNDSFDKIECGFWDYGKSLQRKKGSWSDIGANHLGTLTNNSNLHICSYSHLTNFALLVISPDKLLVQETDDYILELITTIGCILALLGICGIFLTAGLFKTWRQRQGTKILLNISVAITMEIICTKITNIEEIINSGVSCSIIGTILHYFVLAKFMWMLIYAFLQYLRFVRVFSAPPKNLIVKSIIVGWLVPLGPVGLVFGIDRESYSPKNHHFCYPSGLSLYLGVLLPIVIVICINLVIFCVIMIGVTNINITLRGKETHRRQIRLALLLFSMLGMPYWFIVLASLMEPNWLQMVFVYIYSLSATLQGFILFLFYVVFNRETRFRWQRFLSNKRDVC